MVEDISEPEFTLDFAKTLIQKLRERAADEKSLRLPYEQRINELSLRWRREDFNGENFDTKRQAASELENMLRQIAIENYVSD